MGAGPNDRGPVAQAHHGRHRRVAAPARASTTSTSTRSTASTPTRRSKRRSRRCTTSSRPARRATSARRACTRGSSRRCSHLPTRHGWTRFVSMQNHYNLVYREEEREMMPLCREEGIGVIPWSPLARGFLAGNRRKEDRRRDRRARRATTSRTSSTTRTPTSPSSTACVELARPARRQPTQVALAWLLAQPGRHRADRRRLEAVAPRRRGRGARRHADRRGAARPRGAVPAASVLGIEFMPARR